MVRGVTGLVLAAALALAGGAQAQGQQRAEPMTGPGVVTIGNVAPGGRVNLRAGPTAGFGVVGTLTPGTRVRRGLCVGGGSAEFCQVEVVATGQTGFVAGRFLVEGGPPAVEDPAGGPDFYQVRGLPRGERLTVRREPSARAPGLATLAEGEVVRNLGCETRGTTRWCRIRSTEGMDVTGWVAGRYLREAAGPVTPPPVTPPPGGGGGPDAFVVSGLAPGDLLNLRAEPTTSAPVLARLMMGDRVQNLGCQAVGQARWCRVRTLVGADVTGWVNARYLREG